MDVQEAVCCFWSPRSIVPEMEDPISMRISSSAEKGDPTHPLCSHSYSNSHESSNQTRPTHSLSQTTSSISRSIIISSCYSSVAACPTASTCYIALLMFMVLRNQSFPLSLMKHTDSKVASKCSLWKLPDPSKWGWKMLLHVVGFGNV